MSRESRTYLFPHASVYVWRTANGLYRAESPGGEIIHWLDVNEAGDIVDSGDANMQGEVESERLPTATVEIYSCMLEAIGLYMDEVE